MDLDDYPAMESTYQRETGVRRVFQFSWSLS